MTDLRKVLLHLADNAENKFDELVFRLQERLGSHPIQIVPYIGHGTRRRLYLRGRVLEDKHITSARDQDTIWQNLENMYKRINSREIPFARVRATFGESVQEVTANEEGFFQVQVEVQEDLPADKYFYQIQLELIDYPHRGQPLPPVQASGMVIVPPPDAQFGIISDLDDTVIQTNVLDILKMARNTFLRNARTRLPFEGVAAFYRALQSGTTQTYNPIFYVSSSSWNIYDLLVDFFEVRDIPTGTLFLKDLGLTEDHLIDSGHEGHKLKIIQTLLDTHPSLPFLLIGDSSQRDPEIYQQIVLNNPGRILAVYIRDVTADADRDRAVGTIIDKVKIGGVDMLLVPDTVGAAEHAALKGFIPEAALMDIRVERTEDKKPPEPIEKLIDPKTTAEEVGGETAPATTPPSNATATTPASSQTETSE
jgi:phosphatidate phosphatase APP1